MTSIVKIQTNEKIYREHSYLDADLLIKKESTVHVALFFLDDRGDLGGKQRKLILILYCYKVARL